MKAITSCRFSCETTTDGIHILDSDGCEVAFFPHSESSAMLAKAFCALPTLCQTLEIIEIGLSPESLRIQHSADNVQELVKLVRNTATKGLKSVRA